MTPLQWLTLALVVGAVLGTASRVWAATEFKGTFNKQFIIEVIGNGATAFLIPYAAKIPGVGAMLDISGIPPTAAGVVMFFIASGSGDFLGNIRRKIIGAIPGASQGTDDKK